MVDIATVLGPVKMRSPLIAASGTVGSVFDFARVGSLSSYGAAVAKSVSDEPWSGRPPPRVASAGPGMLNGIGIQNPGIDAWVEMAGTRVGELDVPFWGSAVGGTAAAFARVAKGLEGAGVGAVELNLSCPNLESGTMFSLDPNETARVVAAARTAVDLPIGAKLSPNASDIVGVARAAVDAGADWLVLTNTIWGAAIDVETRRPHLSGMVGGYSGKPLKPISLRCAWDVSRALPDVPIVGCGGVTTGADVAEYLLAGAQAVAIGTAHFAEPRAGKRILREFRRYCDRHNVRSVAELVGGALEWQ